ncbi:hypothetical protein PUR_46590 [Paenibacillus sp. URB8-2]|nr:hypothetical protein PUR_46590 [Paenibacillus sp. URB8-2]
MAVRGVADDRLYNRRSDVERERYPSDLGVRKHHIALEDRKNRRNHRLNGIIEQMDEADGKEYPVDCDLLKASLLSGRQF